MCPLLFVRYRGLVLHRSPRSDLSTYASSLLIRTSPDFEFRSTRMTTTGSNHQQGPAGRIMKEDRSRAAAFPLRKIRKSRKFSFAGSRMKYEMLISLVILKHMPTTKFLTREDTTPQPRRREEIIVPAVCYHGGAHHRNRRPKRSETLYVPWARIVRAVHSNLTIEQLKLIDRSPCFNQEH